MKKAISVLLTLFVIFMSPNFIALADVGPSEPEPQPAAPPAAAPVVTAPAQSQVTTMTSTVTTTYESAGRGYTAGDKLARGLANVLTSPLELPRNVQNMTEEQGVLVGWTGGMAQGIGMTALRIIVGAYEIITFPIPFPEDYKPVIEPEFVWQAPGPKLTPQGNKAE